MAEVTFRQAAEEDAVYIGERLREADRREVAALGFDPPGKAVLASFYSSDVAFTGLIDGDPSMMFGVAAPLWSGTGLVWALGTDHCTKHPKEMLLYGKKKVMELLELCPVLENYCDARYTAAHRWLEHIGFTLSEPVPHGRNGELFRKLSIRKEI